MRRSSSSADENVDDSESTERAPVSPFKGFWYDELPHAEGRDPCVRSEQRGRSCSASITHGNIRLVGYTTLVRASP